MLRFCLSVGLVELDIRAQCGVGQTCRITVPKLAWDPEKCLGGLLQRIPRKVETAIELGFTESTMGIRFSIVCYHLLHM